MGVRGHNSDFKGKPRSPRKRFPKGQCMKLLEWNEMCSRDPRRPGMTGTRNFCQGKLQVINGISLMKSQMDCNWLSHKLRVLKLFGIWILPPHALDARDRSTGLNICPTGLWSCFGSFFSPLWDKSVYLYYFTLRLFNLFFVFTEVHSKHFVLSLRRNLDINFEKYWNSWDCFQLYMEKLYYFGWNYKLAVAFIWRLSMI